MRVALGVLAGIWVEARDERTGYRVVSGVFLADVAGTVAVETCHWVFGEHPQGLLHHFLISRLVLVTLKLCVDEGDWRTIE